VTTSRGPVTPQARKPWKKLPIIGAVAAVLFVVGALFVPLVNRTTRDSRDLTGNVDRVAVTSDNGRVEIAVADTGPARVDATRRYSLSRPDVAAFVRGGTLSVRAACPGWAFLSCSTDLRVTVPPGTDVRVRVSGGDVAIVGVQGTIFVRSAAGSVRVENATGRRIDVGTVADNVRIEADRAPRSLAAFSEAGRVELVVPAGAYRLAATSRQGRVQVDPEVRAGAAGGQIDARSKTGDVTITAGRP
jgi:Putative adhesin